MFRSIIQLILLTLTAIPLVAQNSDLFIYREFENAVKKGTRTMDGIPGSAYWVNSTNYKIKASLEPVTGKISGEASIVFSNNSPDDLKNLAFNLYPDLYKKGSQRNVDVSPEDLTDGMNLQELIINGAPFPLDKMQRNKAKGLIKLPEPLKSKTSLSITVKWSFTMPKNPDARIGTYGDSSYFVAYWYPQVAVYDDITGWDALGYEGEHEFYNDNNSFEVELTIPDDILVWATGTHLNTKELFSESYLKRYETAKKSEKPVIICEPGEVKDVLKPGGVKTWKFSAIDVPDFSFSVSNNMRWEAVGLPVENGKRNVLISSVYRPGTDSLVGEVITLSRHIIKYFSEEFPGIPYPYETMTVFNGSGGMEFPMMVNQDVENDRWLATYVTTHEIAHTYFPFLTGTNEKRFSWLDEGMAVYLPLSEQTKIYGGLRYDEMTASNLSRTMGTQNDVPLMIPSHFVQGGAHMIGAYARSGMAFLILENIIGKDIVKKSIQDFVNVWKHKHPTPYDFFFSINKSSGKNLNWFWKAWFFDYGYPSLGLNDIDLKNGRKFEVVKKGHFPVPVVLEILFEDGTVETISKTAEVWTNGEKSLVLSVPGTKKIDKITLGSPKIPDVDNSDNILNLTK